MRRMPTRPSGLLMWSGAGKHSKRLHIVPEYPFPRHHGHRWGIGIILGVGRAIGETMAVIMVAGNQPRIPDSILEGVRTLTANIVLEMGYAADLHREALIATAVVLFVFILLINMLFSLLKRREAK